MRKVLSLVLVLALVLSSFSMAFADDTAAATTTTANAGLSDIAGKACEQSAKVLMNLNVLTGYPDGTFRPDATVTRAEAAVIVIKMLGLEKSVGTQKSNYTDLAGYGWAEPYIAFASNLGILQGDGNGKYRPGDPVSYNEFAKIMVAALGYTADSLTGTWPGNYVNKAVGLGIMDDVVSGGNAPATRGDVAIMVKNNLTNEVGTIDKDGNFEPTVVDKTSDGLGNVVYKYDTPVYRLGGTQVIGVIDSADDAVINAREYLGKYCEYYTNKDGDIIAVKEVKSTTLDGKWHLADLEFTADDVDYKTASDIDFTNPAKMKYTKTATLDTTAEYFVNASKQNAPVALVDDTNYVIEAKVSGKTIKEVYSISTWTVKAALKVSAGDLEDIKEKDPSLLGYDFDTNKDGSINENSFELVGAKTLSDIKADDVVYVYTENNANNKNIVKVAVGTEVVEGEITKINTKDNEWTVNGKAYAFSGDGVQAFNPNKLGDEVKLYLDAYGDIYDYDKLSGTADNYAIVKYASSAREEIKLYMADESSKMFSTDVSNDAKTLLGNLDGTDGYLVGYSLDKNGVVDTLESGYTAGKAKITDPTTNYVTYSGVLTSNKVLGNYRIDDDVVVFTAKAWTVDGIADISQDLGTTKIENLEKVGDNPGNKTFALYLDEDGVTVLAMIADVDLDKGTGTDTYAVISDRAYQKNAVGEKAYNLTGFIDGKAMKDVFTAKEGTGDYTGAANGYATNILVYKLKYDDDGNISQLTAQGPAEGATKATDGGLYATGADTMRPVADGYLVVGAAQDTQTTTCAISAKAVVYAVTFDGANVDEYARYNGTFTKNHMVWLFETNDDEDGYDIIVYAK